MAEPRPIVVTGAAGLLGRAVVAELLAAGHEVVGLDRARSEERGAKHRAEQRDLMSYADVEDAIRGCQAVVHLAALSTPQSGTAAEVWSVNTTIAGNVLAAAQAVGIRRIVVASSQSALGLPYAKDVVTPRYLPVDEAHPTMPSDVYSASKLACEMLAESAGRAGALDVICLRFPVIWDPAHHAQNVARRTGNPMQGAKSLWAYVDARDAACAVRLAVNSDSTGYELLNITSARAFSFEPVPELVRQWFPGLTDIRIPLDADTAVFDWRKAEALLGFKARYAWSADGIVDLDASA
jgi:UDP-glucose 4-epimerase